MPKLELNTFTNIQNEVSFVNNLNENFVNIEAEFNNVISRDGDTPNSMQEDLDMDSNRILNLPVALTNTEPVRYQEFRNAVMGQGFDATIEEGVQEMLDDFVLADGSVTNSKLADDSVSAAKILDGAVGVAELSSNAVTTAKIDSSAVTTAKIADDAITFGKMLNATGTGVIGASGAGDYQHLGLGTGLSVSGGNLQVSISGVGLTQFDTRTAAIAATIDGSINVIYVGGYTTVGDQGGGFYFRSASEPTHAGKFQSNSSTVWWELKTTVACPEQFGAVGDNTTDDTTALNNADTYPANVRLTKGKTYKCTGQLVLLQLDGKCWFTSGERLSAGITSTYNAGPCILVGRTSSLTNWIRFEGISFTQTTSTQTFMRVRWVRGFRVESCKFSDLYKGFELGTTTEPTYIFEFWNNEVNMRAGAFHSHLVHVINSFGQIYFKDSFVEGTFASGSAILYVPSNLAPRVDHLIMSGGYLSRFDYGIYNNHRIVNVQMGANLLQEGWVTANVYHDTNGSWQNWVISNCLFNGPNTGGLGWVFRANVTQTTSDCSGLTFTGNRVSTVPLQPAIELGFVSANKGRSIVICGNTFDACVDTSDNNHALIEFNQVDSAMVDGNLALNTDGSKRFAYLFRSFNSGTNVKAGDNWISNPGTGQTSIT